jgi:peptidoglycan hydrolase-like protein with peptidoglycan-binding domain
MRSVTILVLLVSALALAACGGGDDDAGGTSGSAFDTEIFATTEEEPETETQPAETSSAEPFQITVPSSAPIGPTSPQKAVKQLQRALLLLGYKIGKADGLWGEKTRKAVVTFQKKHNLGADGLVGAKTARTINEELAKLGAGAEAPASN